jgi:hypothetical protein
MDGVEAKIQLFDQYGNIITTTFLTRTLAKQEHIKTTLLTLILVILNSK